MEAVFSPKHPATKKKLKKKKLKQQQKKKIQKSWLNRLKRKDG